MERKMNWGKLRAEKWKRSVGNILSLWEGWCVFPQESQEWFVNVFNNPPLTAKEEIDLKRREAEEQAEKGKSRWKTVEVASKEHVENTAEVEEEGVDGEPMAEDADVDGEPMAEDEDVDGEPMEEDFDGEPMDEDNEASAPPAPASPEPPPKEEVKPAPVVKADTAPVGQIRRRPRAVDMFADSDDEDA
jgi:U2-associated protein SR140